jgi:transcriptional regulator with XRE-family HTH domain
MIAVNELKGRIKAKGLNQIDVAKAIGISSKTFSLKLKKGEFGSDEIEKMIILLSIDNPMAIFFANIVT